jgi:hypothetical protein
MPGRCGGLPDGSAGLPRQDGVLPRIYKIWYREEKRRAASSKVDPEVLPVVPVRAGVPAGVRFRLDRGIRLFGRSRQIG